MKEIDKTKLTDQTKFRLEKITEIQNYFHQEINYAVKNSTNMLLLLIT